MSIPTGASHQIDPGPAALASAHAHVFAAALHAGRKAGKKAARHQLKRALKRAAKHHGLQLPKPARKAILRDAEHAAERAAYHAATKALRKYSKHTKHHQHAKYSRATLPQGTLDGTGQHQLPDAASALPLEATPGAPAGSQIVLEVLRVEQLSEHMVRIIAGGPGFNSFRSNGAADQHVKLHFANPALGLVPPYDMRRLRKMLGREDLPVSRTYTVRRHDPEARELAIDFVIHGDEGIAGAWAAAAQPGQALVMSKPSGKFRPDPSADQHLYVGDEAALPAISRALEMLPGHAAGQVYLEVDSTADRQELACPPGVEVTWLYRAGAPAGTGSLLVDALRALPLPFGKVEVLAHGERTAMHEIRRLVKDWDIDQRRVQVSSYWTAGRAKRQYRQVPAQSPVITAM